MYSKANPNPYLNALKRRLESLGPPTLRKLLDAWRQMDQGDRGRFCCKTVRNNGCVYNPMTGTSYSLKCFFLSLGCMIAQLEGRSVDDHCFVNQKAFELLTKANHTVSGKIVTLDPYDSNDDLNTIERLLRTLPYSIRVEIYATNNDSKISSIPDRVVNTDGLHVVRIANFKLHFEYITTSSEFFYSREVISFLKDTDALDYRYIPECINEILTDMCSRNRPFRRDDKPLSELRNDLRSNSAQLERCRREAEELRKRLRELESEDAELEAKDAELRTKIIQRASELSETRNTVSVFMYREQFERTQQEEYGFYYSRKISREELETHQQTLADEAYAKQIQAEYNRDFNSF